MFTTLFITFLLIDLGLRVWLSSRQIRHVALHRDAVPAEFADRIGLHSHQRAADYTIAKMQLNIVERVVEATVLVALTLMGGLQFLDVVLTPLFDNDIARQLMLIGAVLALMGVIGLPFTVWRIFKLEARFGFNRMTPRLFIQDFFKTLLLALILGTPLVAGVLWIMANAGDNWVWWAWAAWVGFNFLILWLFPTVIAPLFNKFSPLDNPDIADRINNLAKRCDFELDGLFVMDGSKRSAHGNAYFTGFGKSRRIVFFDTLLAKLKPQEVEAVLAHELGHFKHKHIIKRMIISFSMALIFFLALGWLSKQVWFYVDLGVLPSLGRANDGMALILFFLVMPVFTFWTGPVISWFSRRDEFEADRYAAEQSSSQELISALVKLYDDNAATLTPDPLHSAFYDSHPGAVQRIQHLKHA